MSRKEEEMSEEEILLEFADSIPLTMSGKKRFVISEVQPKFV